MQDETQAIKMQVAALARLVETMLANEIASHRAGDPADNYIANFRRLYQRTDHFVPDDDQHAGPISDFEAGMNERTALIVERAIERSVAIRHSHVAHDSQQ